MIHLKIPNCKNLDSANTMKSVLLFITSLVFFFLKTDCLFAKAPIVVTKLKGNKITRDQVIALTERYKKELKRIQPNKTFSDSETIQMNQRNLDMLVEKAILLREAKKLNVQPLKSQMYERMEIIISGLYENDSNKLIRQLSNDGIPFEQYKADLMEIIQTENTKSRLFENISIPENECRAYYKNHQSEFIFKKRHVKHLLISASDMDDPARNIKSPRTIIKGLRPDADENELNALIKSEIEKRKALADSLLALIRSGSDFEEIAKKHSDDASKENGGDLGEIMQGQTDPVFDSTAFSLKKGSYSNVVRTQFGFHIIYAADDIRSGVLSFEEVRYSIESILRAAEEKKIMEKLKKKYKVKIFWNYL